MSATEALATLYAKLAQPSAQRLYAAVQKQTDQPFLHLLTRRDVEQFVARQGAKQVFAPGPRFTGKVTAQHQGDRWAADVISYVSAPSRGSKGSSKDTYSYILIAQDIFSRFIFTAPLRSTSDAVPELRKIFEEHGEPQELNVDKGPEWGAALRELLREYKVELREKRAPEDLATVDRAIGTLRQALARQGAQSGSGAWATYLAETTDAVNALGHKALMGNSPDDLVNQGEAPELEFAVQYKNARDELANSRAIQARGDALAQAGAFRTTAAPARFQRSFKPRWGDDVKTVQRVDGALAYDQDGNEYQTKLLKAVPRDSTAVAMPQYATRGSAQTDTRRKEALQRYVARFVQQLRMNGPTQLSTASQRFRAAVPEFAQALRNQRANFRQFVQLFPESLKLEQGRVSAVQTAAPAPNTLDAYAAPAAAAVPTRADALDVASAFGDAMRAQRSTRRAFAR